MGTKKGLWVKGVKRRYETEKEVKEINKEMFGEDAVMIDIAVSLIRGEEEYLILDSDTEEEIFESIIENFISSPSIIKGRESKISYQFSSDFKAVMFKVVGDDVSYIIATLDSDIANLSLY